MRVVAAALAAALLAAGCGDDGAGEPAGATDDRASTPRAVGEPTVITAAGDLGAAVDEFEALLGPDNGGEPAAYASGRREITWDGVPDELARPNGYPPNFFNGTEAPRARGIVIESPSGELGVSADSDNPDGAPVRFGDVNASYANDFRTFSEERLFSPIGSNVADATFYVPGTDTPAAVRGFGAVYTGVDQPDAADFELFDIDGNSLDTFDVPVSEDGLSFLAIAYDEPIIARVRIVYGTTALGPDNNDTYDVAVMDDFIYGEPQPIHGHQASSAAAGSDPDTLLARLATSTDDASTGAPLTHVGTVDGTDALIAIAQGEDGSVVAYVCDGARTATWYTGVATSESAELVDAAGDSTLTVQALDAPSVTGTVTIDDTEYTFAADRAEPQGDVLLRSVDDTTSSVTGWILHRDRLRGATRTSREITATASVDDIDTIEDTDVPGGEDDVEAARLFPKLACRKKAKNVIQTPTASDEWDAAVEDFIRTGCSVESFMPGANIDSTDNLCLLYGLATPPCGTIQ